MAFTGKRKPQQKFGDGPNLNFFTGLYAKDGGKVIFSAILDSDRAKDALKEAIKATEVDGKISLVILEASKGDADAWAAFAGVQPQEKRSTGKKKFVRRPKDEDEGGDEAEEEPDPDERKASKGSDDDEWA